jgi:urease accessory protein
MMFANRRGWIVSCAAFLASSMQALAHHPMDRKMPGTLFEGLLSGLGHPIIGIDHLAFIVGCGLIASAYRQALWLPLAFVAASSAGALLHFQGFSLLWTEGAIALSLICLGAVMAFQSRLPVGAAAGLFAIAGLFHGYALFESIIGAEPSPLVAYAAGMVISQYGVAVAAIFAVALLGRIAVPGLALGQRAFGVLIGAFGLITLAS